MCCPLAFVAIWLMHAKRFAFAKRSTRQSKKILIPAIIFWSTVYVLMQDNLCKQNRKAECFNKSCPLSKGWKCCTWNDFLLHQLLFWSDISNEFIFKKPSTKGRIGKTFKTYKHIKGDLNHCRSWLKSQRSHHIMKHTEWTQTFRCAVRACDSYIPGLWD